MVFFFYFDGRQENPARLAKQKPLIQNQGFLGKCHVLQF
ncbi:hypothetical protein D081_1410 [Anaerovibrio sp. JC8]|nr:hypothetical protein D081_1410 [Anaerovibrio sp. JC8]